MAGLATRSRLAITLGVFSAAAAAGSRGDRRAPHRGRRLAVAAVARRLRPRPALAAGLRAGTAGARERVRLAALPRAPARRADGRGAADRARVAGLAHPAALHDRARRPLRAAPSRPGARPASDRRGLRGLPEPPLPPPDRHRARGDRRPGALGQQPRRGGRRRQGGGDRRRRRRASSVLRTTRARRPSRLSPGRSPVHHGQGDRRPVVPAAACAAQGPVAVRPRGVAARDPRGRDPRGRSGPDRAGGLGPPDGDGALGRRPARLARQLPRARRARSRVRRHRIDGRSRRRRGRRRERRHGRDQPVDRRHRDRSRSRRARARGAGSRGLRRRGRDRRGQRARAARVRVDRLSGRGAGRHHRRRDQLVTLLRTVVGHQRQRAGAPVAAVVRCRGARHRPRAAPRRGSRALRRRGRRREALLDTARSGRSPARSRSPSAVAAR